MGVVTASCLPSVLLPCTLQSVVVEQLLYKVHMGHDHAPAAVACEVEGVQGLPVKQTSGGNHAAIKPSHSRHTEQVCILQKAACSALMD